MAEYENKKRRDIIFKVGDYVYLKTVNLKLPSNLTKKLAQKYIGPYKIVKVISKVAY